MNALIKKDTSQRLAKLQQIIIQSQADACLISTSVNQFYLLDFIFDGYIFIQPEGEPLLFVKRPSGMEGENVIYIRKPEQIPDYLRQRNISLPRKLMMENDVLPFSTALRLQAALEIVLARNNRAH